MGRGSYRPWGAGLRGKRRVHPFGIRQAGFQGGCLCLWGSATPCTCLPAESALPTGHREPETRAPT